MTKKLFLISLLTMSCVTSERSGNLLFNSTNDPVFIPVAQEQAIGLQSAAAVAKQYKVCSDIVMQSYVQALGKKLAAACDRRDIEYQFTLLENPMVNAFALPGGHVYVTTGILAHLKDEAELASVMGHEVGHVVKQHGVKSMQRQVVASVGLEALLGMLDSDKAAFTAAFAGPAASLLFLRNGREAELDADEQGMLIASRCGYDPAAMIGVQEMLLQQSGKADPLFGDIMQSHPASEARIAQARELLPRYEGPKERGLAAYGKNVLSRLKK